MMRKELKSILIGVAEKQQIKIKNGLLKKKPVFFFFRKPGGLNYFSRYYESL
jgi:hypothetical protein